MAKKDARVQLAKDLVTSLEERDEDKARGLLDELTNVREMDLYKQVGQLTRDLHDSIVSFAQDERITEMTADELPDAKQRLAHVVSLTENAANQTLETVEKFIPLCKQMKDGSREMGEEWEKFIGREMKLEEFQSMVKELAEFIPMVATNAGQVHSMSGEIMLAQGYQDLTGQIIQKVIKLLEEMENKLVNLLRTTSAKYGSGKAKKSSKKKEELDIGAHILGKESPDSVTGQDDVDDLLSTLGF